MAVDLYLVIPPGKGNPLITADPVPDQYFRTAFSTAAVVEVRQFSFGTQNNASVGSASTGAGGGKVVFNELQIEKSVDTLSRSLFTMNATGGHLARMQLYLRKAGGTDGRPYLVYAFDMVFLSKIDWSAGSGDDEPNERLTFAYGALALGYYPQKPDGAMGTAVKASWSQVTNSEPTVDMLTGF